MLKLSLSMTLRDWRAGELRFLLVALALAVASLSAVHFFTDRMGAAMSRDAHQLLGGDLRLSSDAPIAQAWRDEAARLGLHSADTVELASMVLAGEGEQAKSRMVALKAAGDGYPLRGKLSLRDGAAAVPAPGVPAAGEAWADAALLAALDLKPGAAIQLGERRLAITRIIASEPDRGPAALAFSPRLMIGMDELRASGLIQAGSFASHHLLLAGEAAPLAAFQKWIETRGEQGVKADTLASSSASTSDALSKGERFLSLIGLLSAMLASLGVAMAARRFMLRHLDACAMLRCLGLPHSRVTMMFITEFLIVGLGGSAIGVLLGFAGHFVLLEWLGTLVTADLAPASWMTALRGMAVGVLLLVGVGLPPLLQLRDVPHNLLLRGDAGAPGAATLTTGVLGLAMFGVLLVWQAGDLQVGLLTAGAFLAGLLVFSALAWGAVACLRYVPAALDHGVWRLALADMRRRPGATVTQVVALALGLMALLLLTVVRGDLLGAWKDSSPPDAPNHFVVNVQPDQRAAVTARLAPYGRPVLHPSILGRLVALNDKPLLAASFEDKRARDMIERKIDMSTAQSLPPSNTLVAGRWFSGTAPELSVSEQSARSLGLKLGDRLALDIAGTALTATVTSLRKVDWRSRRPNFAFLLNPAAASGLPATFMTSIHVPAAQVLFVDRLVQDYPNLTVFNVGALVDQFQRVLGQVSAAVEFLFLFTLASGILVLYATLMSSQDERLRQAAILRALGASRSQLSRARWIEYALTGSLAGALAATGATAAGWALARFAFQLEWQFSPMLWLAGLAAGAACAMLGGWAGLRAVLIQSPLQSLRTN